MGSYEKEDGYQQEGMDRYYDQQKDYEYDLPTNWNLYHLTLSRIAVDYFKKHKILEDFAPIVDQIMATNKLDWRGAEYYKYMVDELILKLYISGYGDSTEESKLIRIARVYMHQIVDGCKEGYRGKLATELRRVYRRDAEQQTEQKRGIFR